MIFPVNSSSRMEKSLILFIRLLAVEKVREAIVEASRGKGRGGGSSYRSEIWRKSMLKTNELKKELVVDEVDTTCSPAIL